MKCELCYSEKFPWCDICKKSKVTFGASAAAEGGRDSICKCNEKK